jgi:hypothetical protein
MKSSANFIVTDNLKDFPKKHLPKNIQAISPDEFLVLLSLSKAPEVLDAVRTHRSTLKSPPFTVEDYIKARAKQGLKGFAAFLKVHSQHI